MSNSKIKIQIGSESFNNTVRLVAEITIENQEWAYVYASNGHFIVDIYPRQDGKPWTIPSQELIKAFQDAQFRLAGSR